MSIFAKAQGSFIAVLIRKVFRVEVINPENEPESGAYITCANHLSVCDPVIIGACMHKPLRYMAKAELFRVPVLKYIIKWFGAYPVNRSGADVSSIKATINILAGGEIVGMYMQGGRARGRHPKDVEPKHGAAMIAVRAKSGVLPVTIIAREHRIRFFRRTILVFGRYMPYGELVEAGESPPQGSESMSLYKKVTEKIYAEIVANYEKFDTVNK